jgi:hypothetical protein
MCQALLGKARQAHYRGLYAADRAERRTLNDIGFGLSDREHRALPEYLGPVRFGAYLKAILTG